jgi:uncharacterized protein (DUF4415 family)
MTGRNMRKVSLDELARMRDRGELHDSRDAEPGEDLGPEFWANATLKSPKKPRSVHLKLDPDVFDFFYSQSKGKGHLTRMQNVLKAYVDAKRH